MVPFLFQPRLLDFQTLAVVWKTADDHDSSRLQRCWIQGNLWAYSPKALTEALQTPYAVEHDLFQPTSDAFIGMINLMVVPVCCFSKGCFDVHWSDRGLWLYRGYDPIIPTPICLIWFAIVCPDWGRYGGGGSKQRTCCSNLCTCGSRVSSICSNKLFVFCHGSKNIVLRTTGCWCIFLLLLRSFRYVLHLFVYLLWPMVFV